MPSNTPPSGSNLSMGKNKGYKDAGKTVKDLKLHCNDSHDKVADVEFDKSPLPRCTNSDSSKYKSPNKKKPPRNMRRGLLWTENEHRLFLYGLEKFGRGDWKSISKYYVKSKTNSQVASHAQKYYNRLSSHKKGRRASINDITIPYPLEVPIDTICFDSKEASSDQRKQPLCPPHNVERNASQFVREKIVDPGPSETNLPKPSTHNLDTDFIDQLILDPVTSSPKQSPKGKMIAPMMNHELPTNDICAQESSNKLITDLGFASNKLIVARESSAAKGPSFNSVALTCTTQVWGFISHTVISPTTSVTQESSTSHTVAGHCLSTVQLPPLDPHNPEPADEPSPDLNFTGPMITESGPLNGELLAFDVDVQESSHKLISDVGFASSDSTVACESSTAQVTCFHSISLASMAQVSTFTSHAATDPIPLLTQANIDMDNCPSTVEFPPIKMCIPEPADEPSQDLNFPGQMITENGHLTTELCCSFDMVALESSNNTKNNMTSANGDSNVAGEPSTAQVACFDSIALASISQVSGFVSQTMVDPTPSLTQVNFSTDHGPSAAQLPPCNIYAPGPANEPIQDLDITELHAFDIGVPPFANHLIQGLNFANQMILNTDSSTAPPPAYDAYAPPPFIDEPTRYVDLADICTPPMTDDMGFIEDGMIIDPDFSTSQLSEFDDFELSFLIEPVEDTELASPMVADFLANSTTYACESAGKFDMNA